MENRMKTSTLRNIIIIAWITSLIFWLEGEWKNAGINLIFTSILAPLAFGLSFVIDHFNKKKEKN